MWERKKAGVKKEDNNVIVGAPPTCIQPIQGGWAHG